MPKSNATQSSNPDDIPRRGDKLPRIRQSNQQLQIASGKVFDNPFYVPADEEIFQNKDAEKEAKRLEKHAEQNLRIWEKGLVGQSAAGKLREINRISDQIEDDDEEAKEMSIKEAAKSAIKNRIYRKEPMTKFIDKKREMFLYQMAIDLKKEQIKQFEEMTYLHELGLQKSEEMLEQDLENFNKFLEENKNKCRLAIREAEEETKKKQDKIMQIKQLQENKGQIQSMTSKNVETLMEFYNFKVFLDSLTPKDFLESRKKRKEERKRNKRSSSFEDSQAKKNLYNLENLNINKDLQELIEDSDDEVEMYFQNPEQIISIFNDLKEKNLFLFRNMQENEQTVEEFTHKLDTSRKVFQVKHESLTHDKKALEKAIDNINKEMSLINQVTGTSESKTTLDRLEPEIKKVYYLMGEGKRDISKPGIEMMHDIEKKIINQIKEIMSFDGKKVAAELENCVAEHRLEQKKQKDIERELEEKRKRDNIQKRSEATKRYGRPIMAKSRLQKENKQEKNVVEVDEEAIRLQKHLDDQ